MSIFMGKTATRSQYSEVAAATVSAGKTILQVTRGGGTRYLRIFNGVNAILKILIINPDDPAATEIPFINLQSGEIFILDAFSIRNGDEILPGDTIIKVEKFSGTCDSGLISMTTIS